MRSDPRINAPLGYIDLERAIGFVWRRMFTGAIPAWLLDAAKSNVTLAERGSLTFVEISNTSKQSQFPEYPKPIELIGDALRSGDLVLFLYGNKNHHVIAVPTICSQAVLERAGFLQAAREAHILRFKRFLPRHILDDLDLPGIKRGQLEVFALCLREKVFDDWLAGTARKYSWPLDAKPRRGRGRPKLIPVAKLILQDLIDGGDWQQGMLLKRLVALIQSKLKGEKVDRETVVKSMNELYRETGQLEYRYLRRKRVSPKRRASRRILR